MLKLASLRQIRDQKQVWSTMCFCRNNSISQLIWHDVRRGRNYQDPGRNYRKCVEVGLEAGLLGVLITSGFHLARDQMLITWCPHIWKVQKKTLSPPTHTHKQDKQRNKQDNNYWVCKDSVFRVWQGSTFWYVHIRGKYIFCPVETGCW